MPTAILERDAAALETRRATYTAVARLNAEGAILLNDVERRLRVIDLARTLYTSLRAAKTETVERPRPHAV